MKPLNPGAQVHDDEPALHVISHGLEFFNNFVLRHKHKRVPDHGQFTQAVLVNLAKALEHLAVRLLHPEWKGCGLGVRVAGNGNTVVGIVTERELLGS